MNPCQIDHESPYALMSPELRAELVEACDRHRQPAPEELFVLHLNDLFLKAGARPRGQR